MKGGVRLTAGGNEGVRDCVSLRIWSKNKTVCFTVCFTAARLKHWD